MFVSLLTGYVSSQSLIVSSSQVKWNHQISSESTGQLPQHRYLNPSHFVRVGELATTRPFKERILFISIIIYYIKPYTLFSLGRLMTTFSPLLSRIFLVRVLGKIEWCVFTVKNYFTTWNTLQYIYVITCI